MKEEEEQKMRRVKRMMISANAPKRKPTSISKIKTTKLNIKKKNLHTLKSNTITPVFILTATVALHKISTPCT